MAVHAETVLSVDANKKVVSTTITPGTGGGSGGGDYTPLVITSNVLDFTISSNQNVSATLYLSGDAAFRFTNGVPGKTFLLAVYAGSTNRALSWEGWTWHGSTAPAMLASNRWAIFSLYCRTNTAFGIHASGSDQP